MDSIILYLREQISYNDNSIHGNPPTKQKSLQRCDVELFVVVLLPLIKPQLQEIVIDALTDTLARPSHSSAEFEIQRHCAFVTSTTVLSSTITTIYLTYIPTVYKNKIQSKKKQRQNS